MKSGAFGYLLLILPIISNVELAALKDDLLDQDKPWNDVIIHRFYGPWSVSRKRNGDYVDYNDYGARAQDSKPNSLDLPYESYVMYKGYSRELSSNRDDDPSILHANYGFKPIGLAVFRTGIDSGRTVEDEREMDNATPEESYEATTVDNADKK